MSIDVYTNSLPAVHIILRTDTEYEDALIGKTFVFMFVNSFAALFYIAFVKPFLIIDPCLGPYVYILSFNMKRFAYKYCRCMSELQTI